MDFAAAAGLGRDRAWHSGCGIPPRAKGPAGRSKARRPMMRVALIAREPSKRSPPMAWSMLASLLAAAVAAQPVPFAQHQLECAGKQGWSDPAPPIRIFANIYDVGTCGVVVLLITGPKGDILIDSATAEAAG